MLFDPANKFVAVIAFVGKNQLSRQIKRFQHFFCQANIISVSTGKQKAQWITKSIRYRMNLTRYSSRLRPMNSFSPLFCATGMLMHFNSCTIQHKRCLIDYTNRYSGEYNDQKSKTNRTNNEILFCVLTYRKSYITL